MAIARLSMKVGKAGRACPHAAYIVREGQHARHLSQGEKLEACEAGNLPAWAEHDPLLFWQAADAYERSNGTTYREMEIALPRELDAGQRAALVRAFVAQEIGGRHAYQWAIHTPMAADGQAQPHVHLMFSERQVDDIERDPEQYFRRYNAKSPEKGGARKGYGPRPGQTLSRSERAADLKELRSRWEIIANSHLEQLGHSARIDMRSHAERGTGLEPEAKQLPSQWRGEGRENIIEFRQARAALAQAHEHMQQAISDAKAEVINLEAERERRIRDREERSQAERLRIERMTSRELKAEIERLRPPAVKAMVDRHPDVMAARKIHASLSYQMRQAQEKMQRATLEMHAWRKAHPLRARTHDLGLIPSSYLIEREQAREEAWLRDADLLMSRVNDARSRAEHIAADIGQRIEIEQKPVREQVVKLERIWQQKASQELDVQRQARKLDRAISEFKKHAISRALKVPSYSDTGKQWKALPENMRKKIEDFNRLPKEGQSAALTKMREDLRLYPDKVEKLAQELDLSKGRGRGMGRG
ncbi:MobA/MobL family protein [Nitrosospira multiformis]|uniref:MobA/MobL family protein n=1 Tax=Nitrosospira multiformis TaxID=1231 RepID=A0A1H8PY17_9PROT|nr:MobA/MobL family protein [Nitrosospira multiformis]SEO46638.1 MobA/MobL family protein [Nitrosospira multiformis]